MAYTPFDFNTAPYLGELPEIKSGAEVFDVSKYVAADAKEILVYVFISTSGGVSSRERRGVYEIFTEDKGKRYSQLMNFVVAKNDFVTNSANLWLPVLDKKEFKIVLPASWSLSGGSTVKPKKQYRNLNEAMSDFAKGDGSNYTGVFLMGYR